MRPIERAMEIWKSEPCARPFQVDLASHLLYGFVFSTPDLFMMGRPVKHDAPSEEILDPSVDFDRPDGWLVYCAVGKGGPTEFLALEPYPLSYIGWERGNKLRFYRRERLIRHASRLHRNAGQVHQARDEFQSCQDEGREDLQLNAS